MVKTISAGVVQITSNDGVGSGFIINTQGEIITNAHVVGDNSRVKVRLHDGHTLNGQVIGVDQYLDLALIRVSGRQYPRPVALGTSSTISAGQDVLAVGFPLGSNTTTVTRGIVSAILSSDNDTAWIQTDAPINPGNSGGPLLNRTGQVVGVVTSRQDYDWITGRNTEGTGFALAISELKARLGFLTSGGWAMLPTLTPLPIKTTGKWMSWPEIQAKEYKDDNDGEPRILLHGESPYSWTSTVLKVDCRITRGTRELEVYMGEYTHKGYLFAPSITYTQDLTYNVDGKTYPAGQWTYEANFDEKYGVWYASASAEEAIVKQLLKEPRKLVITAGGKEYLFYPRGFTEASKPVLRFCRW